MTHHLSDNLTKNATVEKRQDVMCIHNEKENMLLYKKIHFLYKPMNSQKNAPFSIRSPDCKYLNCNYWKYSFFLLYVTPLQALVR